MSGGLKLYYDLMSQPSRAVYLFLKASKIPFASNPVSLRKNEQLAEDYSKINPLRQVPAIDDNGFKLPESVAILKYLAVKYEVPDHWYPKDIEKRARVDSYMAWQHLSLRYNGSKVFLIKYLVPKMTKQPVDTVKLARFQGELEICLNKMERIFLKDTPYLGTEDISIGDMLGICELMQPVAVAHDVFGSRPKLEAWAARVKEHIGPDFEEAHAHIYKLRELFVPPSQKH